MLQVCQKLGVGFRAHVKSHKTLELSKLQVGDGEDAEEKGKGRADFVVSTLIEAENLVGYVKECQEAGRGGSVSLSNFSFAGFAIAWDFYHLFLLFIGSAFDEICSKYTGFANRIS